MQTIVYSKASCQQCIATKRYLTKHNIDFIEKRTDLDVLAREEALATGFTSAPIIVSEIGTFFGFNIPKLDALRLHQKGA